MKQLDHKLISELKSYSNPTSTIKDIGGVLMTITGKPTDFLTFKKSAQRVKTFV